jgi:hypothetical protein
MISVHNSNFIVGLVCGITAVTFIPLGIVFSIVFGTLGLVFLAIGLIDAAVAAVLLRSGRDKGAAERISHGTAQVVGAQHSWGTQVGARHPVKLTVDFAGGQYTRSLLVPGHIDFKPGEVISVTYAPSDPANFVPVG